VVYKDNWLPHLRNSIPPVARLNRISLYTIALEAWRRGLTLEFSAYTDDQNIQRIQYKLSDGSNTHRFNESSGDLIAEEATVICDDKHLTEKHLKSADVPIPKGRTFKNTVSISEIMAYADNLNFPVVVKPTKGSGGKGVHANIINTQQLHIAIDNLKDKMDSDIIVQEFIEGEEVRLYVLGDRVLSAVNRIPANVIGDGEHSIMKLIEQKNKIRKSVPHLYHRPIKIDKELTSILMSSGFHLDHVPPSGKRIFLRKTSNISTGGDPIEILNTLTNQQKDIAIQATKAIPGLVHSGVDMIMNKEQGNGVVLEVNTKPGIGSHLFPIEGQATDIPTELINYYFPNTKEKGRSEDYYFDLQSVFDSLYGGYNSQFTVAPCPKQSPSRMKLLLETDNDPVELYNVIRKKIFLYKINGFIQKEPKQKISLVISHLNRNVLLEIKELINQSQSKLRINKVIEQDYCKPIKIGFDIIDDLNELSLHELESKLNRNKQDLKRIESENKRLQNRIRKTENSLSWKVTKPLRSIMGKRD